MFMALIWPHGVSLWHIIELQEEIKSFLGCDYLVYQSLEDLVASVIELNPKLDGLEKSIFDGVYPTDISEEYLQHLEQTRLFKF